MRHAHFAAVVLLALVVATAVLMPSTAPVFGVSAVTAAQDAAAVEAALGLDRPTRRLIQQGLGNEGFDPGAPDGLFGPRTRAAIRAWQAAGGEPQSGYLDGDQVAALRAAAVVHPVTASPEPGDPAPVADTPASLDVSDAELPPAATDTQLSETPDTPAAPLVVESLEAPVSASRPRELPPEILIDRRLVRVDRLLARDDHGAAHDVMNEVLALQREHEVALPPEFQFRYAQVAFAAGLPETAVTSLNDYLLAVGREGEFYRDALELLESAEEAVRLADAERRRAEVARRRADAERRRIEARQRENDELARRQVEVAAVPLPRDPLRSGGLAPEMVTIAAGRFQYFTRQDRGVHLEWVAFDQPFAISKYELTRGEFERFADSSRYRTDAGNGFYCDGRDAWKRPRAIWSDDRFDQTDAHPVVCVDHRDAMAYAAWLSDQTGQTYRLPSPAEWQYAARAGSNAAMFHKAHTRGDHCGRANLHESPEHDCTDGVRYTATVGRFAPNRVGVHDMIGNVAEFVLGCGRVINGFLRLTRVDGSLESVDSCEWHVPAAMGGGYYDGGIRGEFTFYGTVDFPATNRRNSGASAYMGFRLVRELPEAADVRRR